MDKLDLGQAEAELCNTLVAEGVDVHSATEFVNAVHSVTKYNVEEINRLVELANKLSLELGQEGYTKCIQ